MAVTPGQGPLAQEPLFEGDPRCDRCQCPAVWTGSAWQHAEAADAVFCFAVFPRDQPS